MGLTVSFNHNGSKHRGKAESGTLWDGGSEFDSFNRESSFHVLDTNLAGILRIVTLARDQDGGQRRICQRACR